MYVQHLSLSLVTIYKIEPVFRYKLSFKNVYEYHHTTVLKCTETKTKHFITWYISNDVLHDAKYKYRFDFVRTIDVYVPCFWIITIKNYLSVCFCDSKLIISSKAINKYKLKIYPNCIKGSSWVMVMANVLRLGASPSRGDDKWMEQPSSCLHAPFPQWNTLPFVYITFTKYCIEPL
jgi:hypothetical protein